MSSSIEKAIYALHSQENGSICTKIDPRVQLIVTLLFVAAALSTPLLDPGRLVWMFGFPIIMSEAFGIGYGRIFMRSLWFLPLIAIIGIFNPLLEREPYAQIGNFTITTGWVSFISIILRGLLTTQALLLLIAACGFTDMCRALGKIGLPKILVNQLLMLYRYISVLLEETLVMDRARKARGFGRKSYPLSMWGVFAGQLLLRSLERAKRVGRAIEARGGEGALSYCNNMQSMKLQDYLYLCIWIAAIACLRFVNLTIIAGKLINLT